MTDASSDHSPAISVITINRNMAEALTRTIASVSCQDALSREYIVVDGASTDGSVEVIVRHSNVVDRWVSEPDRGIYDAMNKGVILARGDWVLFLNSGDVLAAPDTLSAILAAAEAGDDILYGKALVRYASGATHVANALAPEELPFGMICSHQALLARRALLVEMPFRIGKIRSDYEFLLRCRAGGRRFHRTGILIAISEAGGLSDRRRFSVLRETVSLLHRYGLVEPRTILYLARSFLWASLCACVKPLMPVSMIDAARRCKLAVFGVRSARW